MPTPLMYFVGGILFAAFVAVMILGSKTLVLLEEVKAWLNPPFDPENGPGKRRRIIPENTWRYMKVMRDLAGLTPKSGEGVVALGMKALAALSYAEEVINGDATPWVVTMDWLKKTSSANISATSWEGELYLEVVKAILNEFEVTLFAEKIPHSIRQYKHKASGKRLWVLYTGDKPEWLRLENGFTLADLQGQVWASHGGSIHVDFVGTVSKMRRLAIPNDPLYGTSARTLRGWTARFRACRENKIPRSYLLVGPPGTGKSTAALQACQGLGLRVLRLAARPGEAYYWVIQLLRPDVILLDDYDRCLPKDKDISMILSWLTDIRAEGVAVIMTANDVSNMPEALVRPGRVDEVIEFAAPCEQSRYEVIKGYVEAWGIYQHVTPEAREAGFRLLVDGLEGDTEATIRFVAEQLRYDTPENILNVLNVRRRILGKPIKPVPEDVGSTPKLRAVAG